MRLFAILTCFAFACLAEDYRAILEQALCLREQGSYTLRMRTWKGSREPVGKKQPWTIVRQSAGADGSVRRVSELTNGKEALVSHLNLGYTVCLKPTYVLGGKRIQLRLSRFERYGVSCPQPAAVVSVPGTTRVDGEPITVDAKPCWRIRAMTEKGAMTEYTIDQETKFICREVHMSSPGEEATTTIYEDVQYLSEQPEEWYALPPGVTIEEAAYLTQANQLLARFQKRHNEHVAKARAELQARSARENIPMKDLNRTLNWDL